MLGARWNGWSPVVRLQSPVVLESMKYPGNKEYVFTVICNIRYSPIRFCVILCGISILVMNIFWLCLLVVDDLILCARSGLSLLIMLSFANYAFKIRCTVYHCLYFASLLCTVIVLLMKSVCGILVFSIYFMSTMIYSINNRES